jgi:hypothetical protein
VIWQLHHNVRVSVTPVPFPNTQRLTVKRMPAISDRKRSFCERYVGGLPGTGETHVLFVTAAELLMSLIA